MTESTTGRSGTRLTIVASAARLLQEHGPAAVTTRAVAEAAGVQAPTIYRLFGDKDGLLDAVAEHVMATFVTAKSASVEAAADDHVDPVADLRAGWRTYLDFGVANPTLFALLHDPARRPGSAAARAGLEVLARRVHRIARAGRLRVAEARAVDLVHAAGTGAVLTLLATPPEQRDLGLADALLEAVLRQVLTEAVDDVAQHAHVGPAVALRARAEDLEVLTDAERALLVQWLDRVVEAAPA